MIPFTGQTVEGVVWWQPIPIWFSAPIVSLESRRPLDSIPDGPERERAREAREWFKLKVLKP